MFILQGFHILLDTYDGFGGLGTGLLEYLKDEFNSKSLMTFGLTPADVQDNVRLYYWNSLRYLF